MDQRVLPRAPFDLRLGPSFFLLQQALDVAATWRKQLDN